jgi:hypothetical protein
MTNYFTFFLDNSKLCKIKGKLCSGELAIAPPSDDHLIHCWVSYDKVHDTWTVRLT